MISPEKHDALQAGWVRLMDKYGISPADAYPVFDRLAAAHSEPARHYHTLEHVAEMLRVAGRLLEPANDGDAIQLAVWFHDAVHDPRAKDNEARSAELMMDALAPFSLPAGLIQHVAEMILATDHLPPLAATNHLPPLARGGRGGADLIAAADTAVLLDADLAILAADEWRYLKYAEAIRNEYAWVDDAAYRTGRAAVLQAFLDRPRIYRTARFHDMGDGPARRNMAAEIGRLAAGQNPV